MISRELIRRYQDLVQSHGAGFWWSLSLGQILEGTSYKVSRVKSSVNVLTHLVFRRRIT